MVNSCLVDSLYKEGNILRVFKLIFATFGLFFISLSCFAQNSNFLQGELYFRQNESEKAITYLKKAIEAKEDPKAYVYLAMCYYQQGKYLEALSVCSTAMDVPGTNKKVLAFDAGNIAFAMEDFSEAEKWYSLAIEQDSLYAPPVLNRANTLLKIGKLEESKTDYLTFLKLDPDTEQYDTITRLLSLIDNQVEEQKNEEAIRVSEEKKQKQEEHRIEAERARRELEEAERRKKLLEEASSSLQGLSF